MVAKLGDETHVVLDDQEGHALRLEREDVLAKTAGERRIHAGRRFVEQDQLRLRHQRAAELEQLLLSAGEVDGAVVADGEDSSRRAISIGPLAQLGLAARAAAARRSGRRRRSRRADRDRRGRGSRSR